MRHMLIKGLVATAVLAALAGCNNSDDDKVPTTCAEAGSACTTFTVLHTNDNHGRFWQNIDGEYGLAAQKTLVDQIRNDVKSKGGEVLLLSGGDINTGVPESDMQNAVPDFIGMNLIGYDAMAVGNHEFDKSLNVLDMQAKLANFPMLAANIYIKDKDGKVTDERLFDAYRVFDVNGLKIAVIGLTTKDTAHLVSPDNISTIHFADPQEEIQKTLKEIESKEKVDLVFATTHMGHYADGKHGSEAPGDVLLARSVAEGKLQAIIGGHSQNPVCMEPGTDNKAYANFKPGDECAPDKQNGTWIMQAHEWGKYVGRADFEMFNGKLNLASYKLVPINLVVKDDKGNVVKDDKGNNVLFGKPIAEDPVVKSILYPYQQKGQELLGVVISNTDDLLQGDRNVVRVQQTNLGHLLGEAYRTYGLVNADFGVMNSGGIRDSIAAGNVSYRDVLKVQPFGNFVTKATMTGSEVAAYLGKVGTLTKGGYAQLSNISVTIDCDTATANISDINNRGFSPTDEYSFSIISFSAAGGDGYPKIDVLNTQQTDAAVLREFFEKNPMIKAADYEPVAGKVVHLKNGVVVPNCL
ncbi:MAG: bifunctional UDP-sugar hydrolase/5'-nucleotidase UshA [Shewanella sp.]|uniref:bifunctional UDP-sugar hydrolase/5'-nucleotidase UshA n=1 Tax=Shewanella TaxID=22 RepID=UPI0021D91639|nr:MULTISPECIES: bifunctional UDP-sugar hydrolase/5'-nucleotidase UshA [unclassified Shewanella]MCU8033733.1 bifunctional UDP-sugar hydrolase/5'-nucleotidase UshA [Shewanella sp. SM71]MCU8095656.1 bifunctional UDP-sugar hydrolase/5'-nucleotidase UshA [Shewanella sp. SM102]